MASGETATLERYIEASVERLLSGQYSSQNGLILLGSWQEAMPALVHLDPVLEPVDSRVFAVLWIWARQEGRSGTAFPSYDTLLQRCNIQSRRTVARSLAILRITRWVTLCRRVRDPAGRHRGNIYALHDEPLVLPSTLHLDPGYMGFLDTAKTHNHPYVREVARGMWASLEGRIAEGEDVVSASPVSQTDQRIEALSTLAGEGSGNYFGFLRGALSGLHIWSEKQVAENSPADPVQKVNSVQVHFLNSTVVEVKGDQYNRLHTGVRLINLPAEARTVEAAGAWVLDSTGYRLSGNPAIPRRPLSPLAQVPDYMSIEQVLLAIIGGENALVVDIARGRVAVEPMPQGVEVTSRVLAKDLVD